jgi:hypothetical protein
MGERRFISAKAITQALGSTTMMAALRNHLFLMLQTGGINPKTWMAGTKPGHDGT